MTLSLCVCVGGGGGYGESYSFSSSNWCQSVLEEYRQQSLKKYSTFFLSVTWLFQFNETSCLFIHSTIAYLGFIMCQAATRQLGVCDAQNKREFLPRRCLHSSARDGHLINHRNQMKCESVKWATKARYRVLWKHIIENWLNRGHRKNHFWGYDTQTD